MIYKFTIFLISIFYKFKLFNKLINSINYKMSMNIDNLISKLTNKINSLQLEKESFKNNKNKNEFINQENNLNSDINELEYKIKNLELHKFNMDIIDEWEVNNKYLLKNTEIKYLPLQVPNIYCHKYFDDEDFVYMNLKIPTIILNNMTNLNLEYYSYNNELDYFNQINFDLKNEKNNFENYKILIDIIKIYIKILNYNITLSSFQNINNIDFDKIFNTSYLIQNLQYIFEEMNDKICFDYTNTEYENMTQIHKEITYGIKLIMSNINIIINYYKYLNIDNINLFQNIHKERFVRLINNFCVIMIFLKFIIVDLGSNYSLEEFVKYNIDTDSADIEDN